ncbi:MAG: hypothetical protein CGU28_12245 [Candidatus Dactylopiibacterium carminicum]|uniref:Uncharacterized protein n=1 Tax=Candidatus Dactylopiibacterium carminicum TaxID=857335 RepID=A0A272EPY2_9RHOO|nr:hypothetical protein [Candidatus Dactylopiibacterium carminicum]KAF7598411.1 hypothetical protein BGI27_13545 [Candidatus Dactylopiibacterium carminicum]PAS92158.1 MAG: hypothetical protein CGU29_12915 [Candidatus Dactylopiibacterium carminicum]PAS95586.1 MAG: hypothetical protein CGU28_12245 [Candidatus Dactylopiibacterium carminicum]PAS97576.1 MAG: hypothetical protein BSR46_13570 [Candidatus Dactylopiibacterium carminicum]
MVPSFGFFEFEPSRRQFISAEDQERAAFLSEVVQRSTEFGAGYNEAARVADSQENLFRVF